MLYSFNPGNVMQHGTNTRSVQVDHAIVFCQDWLNGQEDFTFFTSGSTGEPKKIVLHRTQLEASAKATIEALKLVPGEKIFTCLNTQLIAGTMMLVRGMVLNSELFITEPTSHPLDVLPEDHDMTFASFAPMQLQLLLKNDKNTIQKLNRFKVILTGGAPLHPLLATKIAALTCKAYHTYGMTETVSHIALQEIGKDTCFIALPGVALKTDERSCLCIKAAVTDNEWVITNDIVELFNQKQFAVIGRADSIINSGGIKIQPERIETALLASLAEAGEHVPAFVTGINDETFGQKLVAVLQLPFYNKPLIGRVREKLEQQLSKYEMPKLFLTVSHFELTASGKTDKKATLAKALSNR